MALVTPQQAAANWARGMQNSTERIRQGVAAVTVAPTEKAIAAIPRQVAGVQEAAASGKTERGLRGVSLDDVGPGASAAQPKMAAFMGDLLPFIESGKGRLDSQTPRGDLGMNLARMMAWAQYMATFKRRS